MAQYRARDYDRYYGENRQHPRYDAEPYQDKLYSRERTWDYDDYRNPGSRGQQQRDNYDPGNAWRYDDRQRSRYAPYDRGFSETHPMHEPGNYYRSSDEWRGDFDNYGRRDRSRDSGYGRERQYHGRQHHHHSGYENQYHPEGRYGYGNYERGNYHEAYTNIPRGHRSSRRVGIEGLNWAEPGSNYSKYGGNGWL